LVQACVYWWCSGI